MHLISIIKRHRVSFALSLLIVELMMLHASDRMPLQFLHKLESFSYDARLRLLRPNTTDYRIVIVDIYEKSLIEQGRWTWGRDKMDALVNKILDTYHINTLGIDVVFAEKDESSGLKKIERMHQQYLKDDALFANALKIVKPTLNYDPIFADSLKNLKIVLGYYFQTNGDTNHVGQLPHASFSKKYCTNQLIALTEASGFGANLSQ